MNDLPTEIVEIRDKSLFVKFEYEPGEPGGPQKEPFNEKYHLISIDGLDADSFSRDFRERIISKLKEIAEEQRAEARMNRLDEGEYFTYF